MLNIVFLDRATLSPTITLPAPRFAHMWTDYAYTPSCAIVERLQEADIAVVNKVPLNADILAQLPKLKLIAVAATGTNNIDLTACQARAITVCNVRNYANAGVPEHVFALLLALSKQLIPYQHDLAQGAWQQANQFCFFNHPIQDLSGKQLGIIGRGALGQAVGKLGEAFGMRVYYAARKGTTRIPADRMSFDTLLSSSDVISLHCPLTADTQNLIDTAELNTMKSNAILINTARGGIINEVALAHALQQKQIAAAAVDVLSEEPPTEDHPLFKLLGQPNFILTPHTAWASQESMQRLAHQLIHNIEQWVAGKPEHCVT